MSTTYDEMIARQDAVTRVMNLRDEVIVNQPTETVPIDQLDGRVTAESIVAPADLPPYDYATMDGYAIDAGDEYPLTVIDTDIFPEDEPPGIGDGETIRIATGAPLPDGANAVIKREDVTVEDDGLSGPDVAPGNYTYQRGSNVAAGETVIERGTRLSPKDAILLRNIGVESVPVVTRFSVGILATGTEIHEGTQSDLDSPMLAGLVRSWGHSATIAGTVPDEYERVENRIASLADEYDVIITTGGTSVGKKDYVIRVLDELGEVLFHQVRLRPGKPIAVARLADQDTVAFAIPGKPVGAHMITTLVARPFFVGKTALPWTPKYLLRDMGIPRPGFEYAVPVVVKDGDAMPLGHVDSPLKVYKETFDASVLSSSTRATRADGFFVTEEDVNEGETVRVIPYPVVE